jgi:hypothetical protein
MPKYWRWFQRIYYNLGWPFDEKRRFDNFTNTDVVQLFNIKDDPRELNNLASQHPDLVELMKKKLQGHIDKHKENLQNLSVSLPVKVVNQSQHTL